MTVRGRVEDHRNYAFDVPIDWGERADIHTQLAGNGGSHRVDVQTLVLDFAGLHHVFREGGEVGLVSQRHARVRKAARIVRGIR